MTLREIVVFLDEPPEAAIAAAADHLARYAVAVTHRSSYSVAFANRGPANASTTSVGSDRMGGQATNESQGTSGAGQIAALPLQLKPEWCRVWITLHGGGAAADAVADYVAAHDARSRHLKAAVQVVERSIFDPAQWPSYEARLRLGMQSSGASEAVIEAKVAALKQRWSRLGRKAPEPREPDA